MSGKFLRVKTRILEENAQAYFSACNAHTLNLYGTHAMETSIEVETYFGNVQKLYKVFALSPVRWKILQTTATISLHSVSKTRWSTRVYAVCSLIKNHTGMLESLIKIEEELHLPPEIQADVDCLITTIWFKVLQCIDDKNKVLQSSKLTMEEGAEHVSNLVKEIQTLKDSWPIFFEEAKQVASSLSIDLKMKHNSRIQKNKRFFDGTGDADYMFDSLDIQFKVQVFFPTMDLLLSELGGLGERMAEVSNLFSPILCPPDKVDESSTENFVDTLATEYPKDLQGEDLKEELRIFYKIKEDSNLRVDGHITSALTLLNALFKKGLENVFPQICICLHLLTVLPVSVALGEHAFSKLTLTKNRLHSATGEERLNHLLTLRIEYEMVKDISFDDVINAFAKMKARKKIAAV
ncbi:hypothetical protein KIL84_020112 [Mauremys mutica]|uniref:HAT C-terminal dimerisation domain-containing protein n=1 Tax=Mauremys mutica TaxID=74926 RepID=A0A9D4BAM7_9SAUR|nr:hypothetical protein KIL84_020112 [Mauremys mutica]